MYPQHGARVYFIMACILKLASAQAWYTHTKEVRVKSALDPIFPHFFPGMGGWVKQIFLLTQADEPVSEMCTYACSHNHQQPRALEGSQIFKEVDVRKLNTNTHQQFFKKYHWVRFADATPDVDRQCDQQADRKRLSHHPRIF